MKHDPGVVLPPDMGPEFGLAPKQVETLRRFGNWLLEEALPAGGIGRNEPNRLWQRHLADSLIFARPFPGRPATLVDLGSGVGLPGIPLAIRWPQTEVMLLDRSGKRVDLARRAVRVLELDNVTCLQGDFADPMGRRFDGAVARALTSPRLLRPVIGSWLVAEGAGVVGGSWRSPPTAPGFQTLEVRSKMLDRAVWLLIMRG